MDIFDDTSNGDLEAGMNFFVNHKEMFMPASLKPGDKVAFISPASAVKEEYVYGAMERFAERGYEPILMPYALGHESGTFAAPKSERLMDLFEALQDPEIKAIFCNRGGYGCTQLLPNVSCGLVSSNPKWLIGYSDISALHALWNLSNVASVHGPMAKHLATMPADDPCTTALFNILENGGKFDYSVAPHKYNREGKVTGTLRGGNLATLNDLAATPLDMLDIRGKEDLILFLEDINEPIYKVNRILWRLLQTGVLFLVKAIIFGQFTDYKPDPNYESMEDMIHDFFERAFLPEMPLALNFPTGHTDLNYPLVEGAKVELDINDLFVRFRTVN